MSDRAVEGLSVLFPVHNQAAVVERALSAWSHALEKLGREYEFLAIDDGSTDSTRKLLEVAAGRFPRFRVLEHPQRRGFGAAVRTGLAAAGQPLLFITACDYPYDPADLKPLLDRIADADPETGKQLDLVNGYRALTPLTGWRKTLGRIGRATMRVLLGLHLDARPGWLGTKAHRQARLLRVLFALRLGDVDSKFKLFRRDVFKRIPIQSDGDFALAEILAKANFLGCLMDELPIARKPGPFPAQLEAPSPTARGRELRHVFCRPDFGPVHVE